jgi:hypothetical protein
MITIVQGKVENAPRKSETVFLNYFFGFEATSEENN